MSCQREESPGSLLKHVTAGDGDVSNVNGCTVQGRWKSKNGKRGIGKQWTKRDKFERLENASLENAGRKKASIC